MQTHWPDVMTVLEDERSHTDTMSQTTGASTVLTMILVIPTMTM